MGRLKEQETNRQEDERLKAAAPVKTWTKESILQLLEMNDLAVGRALLVLYNNQTEDEQQVHDTKYDNGVGFSPYDARKMTGLALFFKRNGTLTRPMLNWLRGGKNSRHHSRIGKYHRQLLLAAKNSTV